MDKTWLNAARSSKQYADGVVDFCQLAASHSDNNKSSILCPCRNCTNRYWFDINLVQEHLICYGFMSGYTTWIFHGETMHSSTPTNQRTDESSLRDGHDEIEEMIMDGCAMYNNSALGSDSDEDVDDNAESFRKLVDDGCQPLYPECKKMSKLHFIVRLMNIKNIRGMSNVCFEEVLQLFKDTLPDGQTLPKNLHATKQYIKSVGLGYDCYDACFNDCIIFRGEYLNASVCPVCNTSRWKSEKTVAGGKRVTRVAQKVIRHFPLKQRIRRMFMCSKTAPLMSWHHDSRTNLLGSKLMIAIQYFRIYSLLL